MPFNPYFSTCTGGTRTNVAQAALVPSGTASVCEQHRWYVGWASNKSVNCMHHMLAKTKRMDEFGAANAGVTERKALDASRARGLAALAASHTITSKEGEAFESSARSRCSTTRRRSM